jgi:hypothetical protein
MDDFRGEFWGGSEGLVTAMFREEIVKQHLTLVRHLEWTIEDRPAIRFDEPLAASETEDETKWLTRIGDALVRISADDNYGYPRLTASIAADNRIAIDEAEVGLRQRFPEHVLPLREDDPSEVEVAFWYGKDGEARCRRRTIRAPEWCGIRDNYAPDTACAFDELVTFRPSASGKLFVLHGPPGVGKTYAIRSLARAWRHWCSFSFVIDPERLFTMEPAYMVDFLTSQDPGMTAYAGCTCDYCRHPDERWTLLVLEDAGDLLHAREDSHLGQGLARLLNLVDGILGQGLRVLVLITTNDEISEIHPAVSRPGRCAAITEFTPLTRTQSLSWLERYGVTDSSAGEQTLAELFALVPETSRLPTKELADGSVRRNAGTPTHAGNAGACARTLPADNPQRLPELNIGPACGQCGAMMQRTGDRFRCTSCRRTA